MEDIQTLQVRIKKALEQGETLPSLAKKANLHRNTLYGYDNPSWNPAYATLARLAKHLPEAGQ